MLHISQKLGVIGVVLLFCVSTMSSNSLFAKSNPKPVYRFAYSVNSLDQTITTFRLDKKGRLRHHVQTPVRSALNDGVLHPSGRYFYAISKTGDTVSIFRVNPRSGELRETRESPYELSVSKPNKILIHPNGRFIYVASLTDGVMALAVDKQTGSLQAIDEPYPTGRFTRSLVLHPKGQFMYAINAHSNTISGFRIGKRSGQLTTLNYSPYNAGGKRAKGNEDSLGDNLPEDSGGTPYAAVIDSRGRYMYVTNWAGSSISAFRISNKDGSLKPIKGSPFQTGISPYAPTIHPSGEFLYVTSWVDDAIWTYRIKNSDGALKPVKEKKYSSHGYSPLTLVFDSSGKRAYVPNGESASIAMFEVAKKSGKLKFIESVQTRPGPWSLAFLPAKSLVKPYSGFAFTVDSYSKKISSYIVNSKSGSLGIAETNSTGKNPRAVTYDGINNLLYVANGESNNLSAYWFDTGTGAITEVDGSPFTTGSYPTALAVYGEYIYVVNQNTNSLSAFMYDKSKGQLKEYPGSPRAIGEKPVAMAIAPSGCCAYIVNQKRNDINVLTYGSSSEPALIESVYLDEPLRTGKKPIDLVVDPTSRYLYVVNAGSNNVYGYEIHYETGLLTLIKGSPFRTDKYPNGIVAHPNGKYVYVINMRSNNISQYKIDTESGRLKEIKPRIASGIKPSKLAMDAAGKYLYVASEAVAEIQQLAISQKNGKLSPPKRISTIGANAGINLSIQYR